MKISINHIRKFNLDEKTASDPAPQGVDALVTKIGAQLGAVEETISVGLQYVGPVVAKIVSCEDHPNADRLHVCMIDDAGAVPNVERDANGLVQVVCGAPNARAGIKVVWLAPGVTVPDSVLTNDPFVLEARSLRGVVSNGMLASPRELAISDAHEGILEIDDETIPVGTSFAKAYNLVDDVVIDMENKMFTHRPDCFGVLGIAREIAGISAQPFTSPSWYSHDITFDTAEGDLVVEVDNRIPEVVPRFTVVPMSNITVGQSPVWLQINLARLGVRPINNVVDLTNYYMLLTGQPLHAYDYDKVVAQDKDATTAKIVVRYPQNDEKLLLLNGKEVTPRDQAIMIATRDRLIGLGGVMGGGDTEVDLNTKNIILECANFDMYSIRRTSMHNGVFTDAVTRFNKGQSPLQNVAIIKKIAEDIQQLAGGRLAGKLVDDNHLSAEVKKRGSLNDPVSLSKQFINERLGFNLSTDEMTKLLRNVEFLVEVKDDTLTVTAPFWRTDIAIPEDIVEEVGRLYGFDHLPLELPKRNLTPAKHDLTLALKARLRRLLSRGGANEVLTYTFVHGNLLKKSRQDVDNSYKISNALSPELQYYRNSLTPSLLDKVNANIRAGYEEFALFELNKAHAKSYGTNHEGLPIESELLAMVLAINNKAAQQKTGAPFYHAKLYLDYVAKQLGLVFEYLPIDDNHQSPIICPFAAKRSAAVYVKDSGKMIGVVGEYHKDVVKDMKLPKYCAGFEISIDDLLSQLNDTFGYAALSKYPKVERDICLRVPKDTKYRQVSDFVQTALDEIVAPHTSWHLNPVDIYLTPDKLFRQITLRVVLVSQDKTLTAEEANSYIDKLAAKAAKELSAERI